MFENKYYVDDNMLKEYVYKSLCRKIIIAGSIVSVVGVLSLLFEIVQAGTMFYFIYLFATIVAIVSTILLPILTLKEIKRASIRLHGSNKPETIITINEKAVNLTEGGVSMDIEFYRITKVKALKNIVLLMLDKSGAVMLKTNAFTKGNLEDLIIFLNEKCPALKK